MSQLQAGLINQLSGSTLVNTKNPLVGSSPSTATVGTSSAQIVASNASRKGLVVINLSSNVVSLAFGSNTAVLNSGITLTQNGSVYETSEYDFTLGAINAIASGASSVVSIQEFT